MTQNRIQDHKFVLLAVKAYGIYCIGSKVFDTGEDALEAYEKEHWRAYPRSDYQIVLFQAVGEAAEFIPAQAPTMSLQPLALPPPAPVAVGGCSGGLAPDAPKTFPAIDDIPF